MIAIICLVVNLEKQLRHFIGVLLRRLLKNHQPNIITFAKTLSSDLLQTIYYEWGNNCQV